MSLPVFQFFGCFQFFGVEKLAAPLKPMNYIIFPALAKLYLAIYFLAITKVTLEIDS
jgi:hypothetical protein